jgi:thiol:disulfide interchange protein
VRFAEEHALADEPALKGMKVVARELTTLNGQMTVMTRADLEAALAHVRAAGDARNGVVVVEFSARWCGGCRWFGSACSCCLIKCCGFI